MQQGNREKRNRAAIEKNRSAVKKQTAGLYAKPTVLVCVFSFPSCTFLFSCFMPCFFRQSCLSFFCPVFVLAALPALILIQTESKNQKKSGQKN
jgi:hypothetical protein